MSNRHAIDGSASAVEAAIERSGRSRRAISNETGIPYATLNRKLAGRSEFTFSELFLISEVLGVRPSRFVPPRLPTESHC
ncbi:helix-turn-helix domain-containing protein [Microbacterium halotolerans]|uniref:helix-turn-helix domain-containing protein n=1 Tax=Microbacterium halotolerans TaxID=246613 RepID=UPI000E6ADC24